MFTTKPYLIRAIHEWCTDEGLTPYLAVQVDDRTRVPREFVRDGQIVLNICADATHQLQMGNDEISFQTRFNGASFPVLVPVAAVVAIYARENGQGMAFEANSSTQVADMENAEKVGASVAVEADQDNAKQEPVAKRGSHLTRIK